jgi:hypothetical protein
MVALGRKRWRRRSTAAKSTYKVDPRSIQRLWGQDSSLTLMLSRSEARNLLERAGVWVLESSRCIRLRKQGLRVSN